MTEPSEPREPTDHGQTEFQELLNNRGVQFLGCPACGAGENTWGAFANAAVNITAAHDAGAPAGTMSVMLAVCGQCGFIAMFDLDVISR